MYEAMQISKRIKKIAKSKKITLNEMLSACNLGINTISHMNHGSVPKSDTLAKIADYLDCSVDYLLGRTNEPKSHHFIKL
uniref:Helix-turn-helix domain-containing protein n=2 Tax=Oscillospiraceae TaxID=216572 RepID=A0A926DP41_9FIRM|nr:helix-turn-helix domain-containing protein [Congzhengia minquanensis]